jgi:hypothetical protein
MPGSPRYSLSRDSRKATRVVETAWANLDALFLECFPAAPSLPGVFPGIAFLFCESIEAEPLHPDGDFSAAALAGASVATYANRAKVTINYSNLPYESDTLLTRRFSFSGEFLTIPSAALKWEGGEVVQDEEISAAKIIPMIEHSITWHRVLEASIPWDDIKNDIGRVNESAIDNAYFDNVAAETLLYMGAELNFTYSTDGSKVWTLEHRFQERRVKIAEDVFGWNHFQRPSDGTWKKLVDDNGDTVYPTMTTADVLALFGA